MATAGERAQRVVIVSSAGQRIEGGPARPIKQLAANAPHNGAPVIRVCLVTDGRAKMGGPAMPVVAVSSGGEGGPVLPVYAT